jgi:hypothetical protein
MVFPDQGLRIKTPPPDNIEDAISESDEEAPRVAKKAKEALSRSRSNNPGKYAFAILGLISLVALIRSAVGAPLSPLEVQVVIGLSLSAYCLAIIRTVIV